MQRIWYRISPPGYNPPINFAMLWNQWMHRGFLWGWWTYKFYSDHQKEPFK